MSDNDPTPPPATEAGKQAADDPTRQRPLDSGGAEANTAEWTPPAPDTAHGEAIAATAADHVHRAQADAATQEADQARDEAEKLSKKERKAREKAEEETRKAEAERKKAEEAERRQTGDDMAAAAQADVSGSTFTGMGASGAPAPQGAPATGPGGAVAAGLSGDDKPEIVVGAAFAGAFLFAKLLKRITNR